MEVVPFFVDFHHFLSIFTIFCWFSRFTHFCRDLHFAEIYALFLQIFFGQNSLLRNITRFLHVWGGGWGGKETDDKIPSFYWNSSQAHDFKHISRVISNLNIERAAELKNHSSAIPHTLFCRGSILLTIYAYKGRGGSRKMTWWQGGGEGLNIPQK